MIMESTRKMTVREQEAFNIGYQTGYENGKRDAVVHGRWINNGKDHFANSYDVSCSVCGKVHHAAKFAWDSGKWHEIWKCCNECGARMDAQEGAE